MDNEQHQAMAEAELTQEEIENLKTLTPPAPKEKLDVSKMTFIERVQLLQQYCPTMRRDQSPEYGVKYYYFNINQMIAIIKPLLKKLDLCLLQPLSHLDGKPAIATIIIDKRDQSVRIDSVTPLPTSLVKQKGATKAGGNLKEYEDPQDLGRAITYMRRYALQSLLFLQAEDTDGK